MIGNLPETVRDRAIVIELVRKMPGEKIIKTGLDFPAWVDPGATETI